MRVYVCVCLSFLHTLSIKYPLFTPRLRELPPHLGIKIFSKSKLRFEKDSSKDTILASRYKKKKKKGKKEHVPIVGERV